MRFLDLSSLQSSVTGYQTCKNQNKFYLATISSFVSSHSNIFIQAQKSVHVLAPTLENEIAGFPEPRMVRTTWAMY